MSDNLTPYVDPTGRMTPIEIMDQNIGQIMDEFNRTNVDWNNFDQTLIMPDGNGVRRVLVGPAPNGQIGFYVSKPGLDILQQFTSNKVNAANLIFNSDQDAFKIATSGTVTITPPATFSGSSVQTQTIAHGLSTTPAFLVYVQNPTNLHISGTTTAGLSNLPSTIWYTGPGGAMGYFLSQARVDATNLYIDLVNLNSNDQTGMSQFAWTYKYYILQETAT